MTSNDMLECSDGMVSLSCSLRYSVLVVHSQPWTQEDNNQKEVTWHRSRDIVLICSDSRQLRFQAVLSTSSASHHNCSALSSDRNLSMDNQVLSINVNKESDRAKTKVT